MKKNIYSTLLISLLLILSGCEKKLKQAEVIVVEPVRHYYPVIQGDIMNVTYEIENISDNPLFIREIQTTCGCILPRDELPLVILPHKRGSINMAFNSIKNTGYALHYIWCYGNFKDSTYVELQFDTNVVPPADFSRDYEELWQHQKSSPVTVNNFVDGLSHQKGYYTDN